jgi:hypothetical protein
LEKIEIELRENVVAFLNELVEILFHQEYFGFEQFAQEYVQKIYDFIEFDLISYPHKFSEGKLKRFGLSYIFYNANNRTTWYIFFENLGNRYLITHVTNNHVFDLKSTN